jgi:hypothetical protein
MAVIFKDGGKFKVAEITRWRYFKYGGTVKF